MDGDDAQISCAFRHRRRNLAAPALQEHIDTGAIETQAMQMQACEKRRQYRLVEPHRVSGVGEDNAEARFHQPRNPPTRPPPPPPRPPAPAGPRPPPTKP